MKLGAEQIQLMNTFDSLTGVGAKDCLNHGNSIVFFVNEKNIKRAIGKKGETVERVKKKFGKNVELFECCESVEKFIRNAFRKAKMDEVEVKELKDKKICIVKTDNTNKKIILQNLSRLKTVKELAKRNYGVEEIRIR